MPILTNVILSAYCACRICCGPDAANLTAIGTPPKQGIAVAAPRNVPLGSIITINGHRYTAEDRTAARYDGRFDIYFRSHEQAKQFGIRRATVIVQPPNGVRGAGCGQLKSAKKGKKK